VADLTFELPSLTKETLKNVYHIYPIIMEIANM